MPNKTTTKKEKIKPGPAVEKIPPGPGDSHIDFFKIEITERMKKRFTDKMNLPFIPERHKANFLRRFRDQVKFMPEGSFLAITFQEAGQNFQVFRWISREQFTNFLHNIDWKDSQPRDL